MNKSQFKKAFMQGLGSAYIELKNISSRERYKEIILWCCLHNTCYDMQCEGGRGIYLYNAIKLYEDKSIFEDAIIKKFMKKKLDAWLFDQFCDLLFQFAEKRVDNYLHNNAKKSKAVDAFLKEAIRFDSHVRQQITPTSLEELIEASYKSDYHSRGIALRFARTASVEDLSKLAYIALNENDPKIKLELLWVFRKVRFPLDERFIFELAEYDDESIRDIAFDMMKNLSSDKIHDYAINLIKGKKEMANSLSLLCHCYHPEDEAILIEGVKSLPVSYDDGVWHGVFMDIEDLLDNHRYRINSSLFIYIYIETLCSYCRASLAKKMFKRKILPHNILEECLYDSYNDTRKFAERKLNKLTSSKL